MSPPSAADPIQKARQLFAREDLPFPPVPEALLLQLDEAGEGYFATKPIEFGPYNIEVFIKELVDGNAVPDYAVVGFDGHGINSWALHYFLVERDFALFLQLPWGGAYDDTEQSRRSICETFEWASAFQGLIERKRDSGKIPSGYRLVVVSSDFAARQWAWVPPSESRSEKEIPWQSEGDVLNASATSLVEVLNGTSPLPI
jgi:hypothetical protein